MNRWPVFALVIALAGFSLGLWELFKLRFEAGDNYPAYSSLRTDPLGTKALHDSAAQFVSARRNYRPLGRLEGGPGTTLLFLGIEPNDFAFDREEFQRLETFVRSGGRLVITLFPAITRPRMAAATTNSPVTPAADHWGFSIQFKELDRDPNGDLKPVAAERKRADPALPEHITLQSAHWFGSLEDTWQVIYERATNQPVVIERPWGDGAIVLCADSYAFSNQAMRENRQPELLVWCLGATRDILFDETHLGVREEPGVASLARKYRLHGFIAALLVLAALFVWQTTTPFLPPASEPEPGGPADTVAGRDAASGFVNLLRRNIPPADLLAVCLAQWNAHMARTRRPSLARLEAMQQRIDAENALEPRQRDPVGAYRRFCEILRQRRGE